MGDHGVGESGARRLLDKNPLDGARRPRRENPRRPVASGQRSERTRAAIVELMEAAKNDPERRKWLRLEMVLAHGCRGNWPAFGLGPSTPME